ncbi:hypothetical protein CspeluHIS016_0203950 [Cutaneotrichosporon spelunceum]|uniref:Uncharacterized protein n=1 Tax=Cutaneotrichosporon spelunceum TaxID=1672016 RepID=A0AAD3TRI3_9TREE|nr:hypothetical protein CspeluHIS016_0203950 [Cutaneotrichosporon spelunceum]
MAPSWIQSVLNACPLAAKFKGDRLPIPTELRQLPYFQKRFKNKYAHLYRAHDDRGLKCPMDIKTMEDIVSFCQHVMRSDDIVRPTKDVARVFLARVLNVYNAQNPVRGSMDEDVFDQNGNLKPQDPAVHMREKASTPVLHPEQADELEAAAMRLSADQDRRRMRRMERHIVKLEARLTLLEPDSDGESTSPPNTGQAKPSLDVARDKDNEGNVSGGVGVARIVTAATGTPTTSGIQTRTQSGQARTGSGAAAKDKDKDVRDKERERENIDDRDGMRDKDVREAKLLLREVPVMRRLGRGPPPPPLRSLRTPPPAQALR